MYLCNETCSLSAQSVTLSEVTHLIVKPHLHLKWIITHLNGQHLKKGTLGPKKMNAVKYILQNILRNVCRCE